MDLPQTAGEAIRRGLDALSRHLRRRQRVAAGPRGRGRGFPGGPSGPGGSGGGYGRGFDDGGAGVREPRRPLPTSGAGAAAATPSAESPDRA